MLKATLESTLTGIADAVKLGLAQEPHHQVLLGIRERLQAMPYRDVRNRVGMIRDRVRRDTDQLLLLTGDEPQAPSGAEGTQALSLPKGGGGRNRQDAKDAKTA